MSDARGAKNPCKKEDKLVKLAVFDFDGTSITGNSPVLLVRYLFDKGMLEKRVVIRLLIWAFAYKFRLPQSESWVRGLVFRAFQGKPKEEVDEFLFDFYDRVIESQFRPEAEKAMLKHQKEGCLTLVVSATFEPIVLRAMKKHPFDYQISTKMKVDSQGFYTCQVDGIPVEGSEKLNEVSQFANERFGEDGWELAYAYGDHHSDRTLLKAATKAYAVTPDNPLKRTAQEEGWEILDWS